MGKHFEQQTAARQFYADAPRPKTAREVCEEDCDDARSRLVDEWAEKLVRGGMARLLAQQCAEVVVEVMQAKDQGLVALEGGQAAGVGMIELLEGLRTLAVKLYQAPRPRLSAGCLLLAMGETHRDFRSARELAERQQSSHELAANGVEEWQRLLGLPKTSGQKGEAAVATYQNTNGKLKLAA